MPVSDFLKDLPSVNKSNFSNASNDILVKRERPKVIRNVSNNSEEKKIICDKKPLLLHYLQSQWSIRASNSTTNNSNMRCVRSERKRTSDAPSADQNDLPNGSSETKTRRME